MLVDQVGERPGGGGRHGFSSVRRRPVDRRQRDHAPHAGPRPDLWDWHPVRERSLGTAQLHHPVAGLLEFRDCVLRPADADDQLVIFFQAVPGSDTEARFAQLRRPR